MGSQRLPSGRQRHVHKVLIFQKAFEGICQRSLKRAIFKDNTILQTVNRKRILWKNISGWLKAVVLLATENALANIPDNYSTSGRIGRTSWISLSTFFSSSGKKEDFVDSFSSSQQLGERYI